MRQCPFLEVFDLCQDLGSGALLMLTVTGGVVSRTGVFGTYASIQELHILQIGIKLCTMHGQVAGLFLAVLQVCSWQTKQAHHKCAQLCSALQLQSRMLPLMKVQRSQPLPPQTSLCLEA